MRTLCMHLIELSTCIPYVLEYVFLLLILLRHLIFGGLRVCGNLEDIIDITFSIISFRSVWVYLPFSINNKLILVSILVICDGESKGERPLVLLNIGQIVNRFPVIK